MSVETGKKAAYLAQDRGDRTRPGRFHSRYWHLTLLLEKLKRVIDSDWLKPGDRLIDYGCGNQPYESLFRNKFDKYIGADYPGNPHAELIIGPQGQLPVEDQSVDCVLSTQVLEHVADPQGYLCEAYRVLRPGGSLILSTHGVWRYHPDPADYHRWTIEGLRTEIRNAGFEIWWTQSVFGMASCALQLWQDATVDSLPRRVQPLYIGLLQSVIGLIERRHRWDLSLDASVYVVAAERPVDRCPSELDPNAYELDLAWGEMELSIPAGSTFILVDEGQWGDRLLNSRSAIPFLERDGEYWGPPADSKTGIRECERLRRAGANFMVFGWPAFWWLTHYAGLHRHLRSRFRCIFENDRLVVFDLQT